MADTNEPPKHAGRALDDFDAMATSALNEGSLVGIMAVIVRKATDDDPEEIKLVTCFNNGRPSDMLRTEASEIAAVMAGKQLDPGFIATEHDWRKNRGQ